MQRVRPGLLARRPGVTVLVGAVAIAFSGIFFRLSHVSPSTGAFFRCFWALPLLWVLARWEERRWGPRPLRVRAYAWVAGLFFTADLILWHRSIDQVGAGLSTVLANTQVVLVGLLAWLFFRERPTRLPRSPSCASACCSSPVRSRAAPTGPNPGLGAVYGVCAGLAYTGFLLLLREGQRGIVGPAGPLFDATLAAAFGCAIAGEVIGDLDLTPSLAATGWLVLIALSAQVLGWLLIAISLPRLPAVVSSVSLTLQPVCSVLFAAWILGESPSWLQLVGAAAIVSGLVLSTVGRRQPVALPEPAGP